jgi:hypothetical protein
MGKSKLMIGRKINLGVQPKLGKKLHLGKVPTLGKKMDFKGGFLTDGK